MKLTKNFSLSEFKCNDGTDVPEVYICNVKRLAKNLQVIRDFFGKAIIINSGYRTPTHNKAVGGGSKSQHLTASAGDLRIKGMSSLELKNGIEELIRAGEIEEGGLGLYDSFVHYDVRGRKARWDFRK